MIAHSPKAPKAALMAISRHIMVFDLREKVINEVSVPNLCELQCSLRLPTVSGLAFIKMIQEERG